MGQSDSTTTLTSLCNAPLEQSGPVSITVFITGGSLMGQQVIVPGITQNTTTLQFAEKFIPELGFSLLKGSLCTEFLNPDRFLFMDGKIEEFLSLNKEKSIYERTFGGSTHVTCFIETEEKERVEESLPTLRVDVQSKSMEKIRESKTAPDWRYYAPGLTMEGLCKNQGCVAKDKKVLCRHGYTSFSLGKDESLCPMCSKAVEPIRPMFFKCNVVYKGMKPNKGQFSEPMQVFNEDKLVTHKLENGGEEVVYAFLIIDVGKLEDELDSQTQSKVIVRNTCPKCAKPLLKKDAVVPGFCGHCFHKECIDDWGRINNCCPLCSMKFK